MGCKFCEDGPANDADMHPACWAEAERRLREWECMRCGVDVERGACCDERLATERGAWCDKCSAMDDPPPVGYPGGG